MSTVGIYLRDTRESLGLSLRAAAEVLKISAVELGRIERNKTPITEAELKALVARLQSTAEAR